MVLQFDYIVIIAQVLFMHCINHSLALAAAQASDSVPYLKKFKSILQSHFYFYQNSPVCMASLHSIQEMLNDPIVSKPRRMCVGYHMTML